MTESQIIKGIANITNNGMRSKNLGFDDAFNYAIEQAPKCITEKDYKRFPKQGNDSLKNCVKHFLKIKSL